MTGDGLKLTAVTAKAEYCSTSRTVRGLNPEEDLCPGSRGAVGIRAAGILFTITLVLDSYGHDTVLNRGYE